MKRPGAVDKTLERIQRWREICPDITIRSTFIVGFPGETEAEFEELLDFLDEAQLDRVGAFAYSPVDGAAANALPDPVPEDVKQERLARFMERQAEISEAKLADKVGSVQRCLVDAVDGDLAIARSMADAPEIDGLVQIQNATRSRPAARAVRRCADHGQRRARSLRRSRYSTTDRFRSAWRNAGSSRHSRNGWMPASFAHPVFDGLSIFQRLADVAGVADTGTVERCDAVRRQAIRPAGPRPCSTTAMHYEVRIAERHIIATRAENWHDLFNAMIWCRYPAIKQALNARQVAHIATMGIAQRNRAQYALTQFDEAGVIVRVRDPALLALWDRHDWSALFQQHASAWRSGDLRIAAVIGHALLEHALVPELLLVGKCLVVQGDVDDETCIATVACAIGEGRVVERPAGTASAAAGRHSGLVSRSRRRFLRRD